jgi:beta-lactam-binding protein with PASTA domain
VAAPVGGQILSEVLPYLEIEQGNTDEVEEKIEVEVPDVIGKTVVEAEKIIEESNLEIQINNETEDIDKENAIVTNQLPQGGIKAYNGSCVYVDLK